MKVALVLSYLVALCLSQAIDFDPSSDRTVSSPYWLSEEASWDADITGRDDLADSVVEFSLQAVQFGYPCYYSVWVDSNKVSHGVFTNVAANIIHLLEGTFAEDSTQLSIRTTNCYLGRYAVPFLVNGTGTIQASPSLTMVDLTPRANADLVPGGVHVLSNTFPDNLNDALAKFSTIGRQDGICQFSSQACDSSSLPDAAPFFFPNQLFLVNFTTLPTSTNGYVVELSAWGTGETGWSYYLCNSTTDCNDPADYAVSAGSVIDRHTYNIGPGTSNVLTSSGSDENKFTRSFFEFPTDTSYYKALAILPPLGTSIEVFPYAKVWNLDITNDDVHQLIRLDDAERGNCLDTYGRYTGVGGFNNNPEQESWPQYGYNFDGSLETAWASPITSAADYETFFWICPPTNVRNSLWNTALACSTAQSGAQANSNQNASTVASSVSGLGIQTGFGIVYSLDLGSPAISCESATPGVFDHYPATGLLSNYDIMINNEVAATVTQHQATVYTERGYSSGIGSVNGFHLGESLNGGFDYQYVSKPGFSMTLNKFMVIHALPVYSCVDRATSCSGKGECDNRATGACKCDLGFTGDDCTELVKYCRPDSCMNDGVCSENPLRSTDPNFPHILSQATTCDCSGTAGTSGLPYQGERCEIVPPCDAIPCLNGGICSQPQVNNFTCDCSVTRSPFSIHPYIGKHCEFPQTAPCERNPCRNNGTCTDGGAGTVEHTCACTGGWLGLNCEIPPIGACADPDNQDICGTHGVCIADRSANSLPKPFTRCVCLDGWGGADCQTEPVACQGRCQNGGLCIHDALLLGDGADSAVFACICQPPWVGSFCQWNSTEFGSASTSSVSLIATLLVATLAFFH